ncbi:MAG: hypothetical protein R3A10_02895 [Caldilineaceae bacterium]
MSLLALVVGVFLIYNTVTFSVVQRRPVLGSLRPGHDPAGNLRLDPAGSVDPRRVGDVAGTGAGRGVGTGCGATGGAP